MRFAGHPPDDDEQRGVLVSIGICILVFAVIWALVRVSGVV